jgi:predicted ArsR family transcriptional regulator
VSSKKSNFLLKILRTLSMEAKGWTIKEMAQKLGIPPNTIKQRVFQAGIKPITREAIYPLDTLDRIRDAPMGRPKAKPEAPDQGARGRPSKTKP